MLLILVLLSLEMFCNKVEADCASKHFFGVGARKLVDGASISSFPLSSVWLPCLQGAIGTICCVVGKDRMYLKNSLVR